MAQPKTRELFRKLHVHVLTSIEMSVLFLFFMKHHIKKNPTQISSFP